MYAVEFCIYKVGGAFAYDSLKSANSMFKCTAKLTFNSHHTSIHTVVNLYS